MNNFKAISNTANNSNTKAKAHKGYEWDAQRTQEKKQSAQMRSLKQGRKNVWNSLEAV